MTHERRNEPFRYIFEKPLPGFYQHKLNREQKGSLQVIDISMNGLRFSCDASASLEMKDEVIITFIYDNETLSAEGRLIWVNEENGKMTCGLHVLQFSERLRRIIDHLGEDYRIK